MTILLPALAVAGTAFCVWFGVRIVNRRERWAKRTLAAAIALPVLYALSMGPAWWFVGRQSSPIIYGCYYWFYSPISWAYENGPEPIQNAIDWYINPWYSSMQPDYLGDQFR